MVQNIKTSIHEIYYSVLSFAPLTELNEIFLSRSKVQLNDDLSGIMDTSEEIDII